MSRNISIVSHKGVYEVEFNINSITDLVREPHYDHIFIIDKNVSEIYQEQIEPILSKERYLIIEASEKNKSLNKFPNYIQKLVDLGVTRDQSLIAIGGGIIQDITCFIASTLMRGIEWDFYPTTLLAQSDSCIGSKSSINSGDIKNILGTFNPPRKIILDVSFLETLERDEVYSGIGEMIKVHAINSPESFDDISDNYEKLLNSGELIEEYIYRSLLMKKNLIEMDEFDKNERNVMNYGHSFGHAIETATNYSIPHGIAVTIGMDMANYIAVKINQSSDTIFRKMHQVLEKNASEYRNHPIDHELVLAALYKDKKNTKDKLRLILPDNNGFIGIGLYDKNPSLGLFIQEYLQEFQA